MEKAALKFAEGKRALIQNQNQLAVDAFAEACALQSAVHGDMSATMCEFYYYYGRALLDLARIEGDVLGNALAGVPEGEDMENSQVEDPEKLTGEFSAYITSFLLLIWNFVNVEEERDTVAQQVDEALEENFKKNEGIKDDDTMETEDDVESKDNEEKTENGEEKDAQNEAVEDGDKTKGADDQAESSDVKKAENGEDKKAENAEDKKTENEDEEATETENAKEKTDEDSKTKNGEEKVSNEDAKPKSKSDDVKKSANGAATDLSESEEDVPSLQLAWEVLELAKTIYEKNANLSEEENTKLSQVYLKLGEVSLENENYPESINMYSACLKIQESILEADDRWLAETHYQLGLAHSLADNFDVAVEHLQSAISVIEARIKNVSQKLEKDNIKISDDLETSSLSSEQKLMVSDVRELQKLLPELQEKMTDIKDTKASFTEKLKAMKVLL
ncbi:hypothetical protein HAZT_HAZT011250 [Hyalella azteca]|uniref:Uncharacterized protein n=1 Tax=Hyalella azteca TaxID=294128 RepID=A0A6A0H5A2_HYAAZ|nr:hypothetical protein HAZT_HAZT011250 [Hyalella azteca]